MYLIKSNKLTRHEVVHFIQLYHMNVEFFNVQIKTKTLFLVVNFNSIYDFIQIVFNGNRKYSTVKCALLKKVHLKKKMNRPRYASTRM